MGHWPSRIACGLALTNAGLVAVAILGAPMTKPHLGLAIILTTIAMVTVSILQREAVNA